MLFNENVIQNGIHFFHVGRFLIVDLGKLFRRHFYKQENFMINNIINRILQTVFQAGFVFKLTITSVFLSALISPYAHAESVRVGYFIASPHVIVEPESNRLTGACVEFFEKHIAPEMGITVVWGKIATSIPNQLNQIKNQQLDACLVFAKNEERAKILNYPENPYFASRPTLAFLKGHPIKTIETPDDISGLLIGYGKKAYLSPFMRDKRITFDLVSTPDWVDANLRKLLTGKNDAMYQPERASFLYYMRKNKLEDRIKLISFPEKVRLYTTFSKKADKSLAERYDRAFKTVNGTDLYIKILSKYLDIDQL